MADTLKINNSTNNLNTLAMLENRVAMLETKLDALSLRAKKDIVWKQQLENWLLSKFNFDLRLQTELKLLEDGEGMKLNQGSEKDEESPSVFQYLSQRGVTLENCPNPSSNNNLSTASNEASSESMVIELNPSVTITTLPASNDSNDGFSNAFSDSGADIANNCPSSDNPTFDSSPVIVSATSVSNCQDYSDSSSVAGPEGIFPEIITLDDEDDSHANKNSTLDGMSPNQRLRVRRGRPPRAYRPGFIYPLRQPNNSPYGRTHSDVMRRSMPVANSPSMSSNFSPFQSSSPGSNGTAMTTHESYSQLISVHSQNNQLEQEFIDKGYIFPVWEDSIRLLRFSVEKIVKDYDDGLWPEIVTSKPMMEQQQQIPFWIRKRLTKVVCAFLILVYGDRYSRIPREAKEGMAASIYTLLPYSPKESWWTKAPNQPPKGQLHNRLNNARTQMREQRKNLESQRSIELSQLLS